MRICLITPEFPPFRYGGIGRYVKILAEGLAQKGHDVVVTGFELHPQEVMEHEWGRSISVRWTGRFLWRVDIGSLFRASLALRRMFQKAKSTFDLIEAPNYEGRSFLMPSLQCPLVVRLSTPYLETITHEPVLADKVVDFAERRLYKRATLVIANSRAMSQKAQELYRSSKPVEIIPHGIEIGAKPHLIVNDTVDLLFIGRAEYRKGMDVILKALDSIFQKEHRLTITFIGTNLDVFVRKDPDLSRIVMCLRTECPDRFRELGFIDEEHKNRMLQEADWLLVPSRFESFGLVALEAMRMGTPVIASRGSGIEEVAGVNGTTLFVPPGDVKALVATIQKVLELGAEYKAQVMKTVRETFLSRFSANAMIDSTERVYAKLHARMHASQPQSSRNSTHLPQTYK